MKLKILGILVLVFVSCKQNDRINNSKEVNGLQDSTLVNQKKINQEEIKNVPTDNIDLDFEVFLQHFNTNSDFQISRVKFPITSKELDYDNYEIIENTINMEDYRIIDLTFDPNSEIREFDKYTQKTYRKDNKRIIEIRGIDNGINSDYEFEKIDGKWYLISWSELST